MPFVSPVGISPEQVATIAARWRRSHVEFCREALSDWFPTKMPWVHRGIVALVTGQTAFLLDFGPENWKDEPDASWTPADLQKILTNFIDERTGQPIFRLVEADGTVSLTIVAQPDVAILMPRGFSKTTLINSISLRETLFKLEDFFLYASESAPHAERQMGTIRAVLEEAYADDQPMTLIGIIFGNLVPDRQSSKKWTDKFIETLNDVMFGAVGTGGQVRGFGKHAKRPGKIIFDDLQDQDTVRSEEERNRAQRWFWQAALPAVRKGGRRFVIGTYLGPQSLLHTITESSMFSVVRFGALDRQGDPLWEWQMDREAIERLRLQMQEIGKTVEFYLEYMSEYRDDTARMFPESKLVYVSRPMESIVAAALAQDPAISENAGADFCTFALTGIERGGQKHVLDFYGAQGMDPGEQADKFFEMHYRALELMPQLLSAPDQFKHGVEAVAFQRALIFLYRQRQIAEVARVGAAKAMFEITPIKHRTDVSKVQRVQGILKPLISAGWLSFAQKWPVLHDQLINWPQGKRDGPDCVAMSIALLDPFVTIGLDEAGEADLLRDRAPSLRVALGGRDFRRAP